MTKTIAPQTTGVTFFELPLRGESFGRMVVAVFHYGMPRH